MFRSRSIGKIIPMAEKTDYRPVAEKTGETEKRRKRRKWGAFLAGAHLFWVYALILGAILAMLSVVLR
jgi:hypothetical protein